MTLYLTQAASDRIPCCTGVMVCWQWQYEYVYSPMKAAHIHRDIKVYKIDKRTEIYTEKKNKNFIRTN